MTGMILGSGMEDTQAQACQDGEEQPQERKATRWDTDQGH